MSEINLKVYMAKQKLLKTLIFFTFLVKIVIAIDDIEVILDNQQNNRYNSLFIKFNKDFLNVAFIFELTKPQKFFISENELPTSSNNDLTISCDYNNDSCTFTSTSTQFIPMSTNADIRLFKNPTKGYIKISYKATNVYGNIEFGELYNMQTYPGTFTNLIVSNNSIKDELSNTDFTFDIYTLDNVYVVLIIREYDCTNYMVNLKGEIKIGNKDLKFTPKCVYFEVGGLFPYCSCQNQNEKIQITKTTVPQTIKISFTQWHNSQDDLMKVIIRLQQNDPMEGYPNIEANIPLNYSKFTTFSLSDDNPNILKILDIQQKQTAEIQFSTKICGQNDKIQFTFSHPYYQINSHQLWIKDVPNTKVSTTYIPNQNNLFQYSLNCSKFNSVVLQYILTLDLQNKMESIYPTASQYSFIFQQASTTYTKIGYLIFQEYTNSANLISMDDSNSSLQYSENAKLVFQYSSKKLISSKYKLILIISTKNQWFQELDNQSSQNQCVATKINNEIEVVFSKSISSCIDYQCKLDFLFTMDCLQNINYKKTENVNNTLQLQLMNDSRTGKFEVGTYNLSNFQFKNFVSFQGKYPIFNNKDQQVQKNLKIQVQLQLTQYLIKQGAKIQITIPQFALYYKENSQCVGSSFTYQNYTSSNSDILEYSVQNITLNITKPKIADGGDNLLIEFTLCNLQNSYTENTFLISQFTYKVLPLDNDADQNSYLIETVKTDDKTKSDISTQSQNFQNIVYTKQSYKTGQIDNQTIEFNIQANLFSQKSILVLDIPACINLQYNEISCKINTQECDIYDKDITKNQIQIKLNQDVTQGQLVSIVFDKIQNSRNYLKYENQVINITQNYLQQNKQLKQQATYNTSIPFNIEINPAALVNPILKIVSYQQDSNNREIYISFSVTNEIKTTDQIVFDFSGSSLNINNSNFYFIKNSNEQVPLSFVKSDDNKRTFISPFTYSGKSTSGVFQFNITKAVTQLSSQSYMQIYIQDSDNKYIHSNKLLFTGGMVVERDSNSIKDVGKISSYLFLISLTNDISCKSKTTVKITLPSNCIYSPQLPSPSTLLECNLKNNSQQSQQLSCSASTFNGNQVIDVNPCLPSSTPYLNGSVLAISINLMNSYFIGNCSSSDSFLATISDSSNQFNFQSPTNYIEESTQGNFKSYINSTNYQVNAKDVTLKLSLPMNSVLVDQKGEGIIEIKTSSTILSDNFSECNARCSQPQQGTEKFSCNFKNSTEKTYQIQFTGEGYCQSIDVQILRKYNLYSLKSESFNIAVYSKWNTNKIQETSTVSYQVQQVGSLIDLKSIPSTYIANESVNLQITFKPSMSYINLSSQTIRVYLAFENKDSSLISKSCKSEKIENKTYLYEELKYGNGEISVFFDCFMNRQYQIIQKSGSQVSQLEVRTSIKDEKDGEFYKIDQGKVDFYKVLPRPFESFKITQINLVSTSPDLLLSIEFSKSSITDYLLIVNFPDKRYIQKDSLIKPQYSYRFNNVDSYKNPTSVNYYSSSNSNIQIIKSIIISISTYEFSETCTSKECTRNQLNIKFSEILNINAIYQSSLQIPNDISISIYQETDSQQQIYFSGSKSILSQSLEKKIINQFYLQTSPSYTNSPFQLQLFIFIDPLVLPQISRQFRFTLPNNLQIGNLQKCQQVLNSGDIIEIKCSILPNTKQLLIQPQEYQRNITLIYNSLAQTEQQFNNLSLQVDETIDSEFYPAYVSQEVISFKLYPQTIVKCEDSSCLKCLTGNVCTSCEAPKPFLYQGVCYELCPSGTIQYKSTCAQCGSNCKECLNGSFCQQCSEGYIQDNGICVKQCPSNSKKVEQPPGIQVCEGSLCKVQNCFQCSSDSKSCINCSDGFHLDYSSDGTIICKSNQSKICTDPSTYYDEATKKCKKCSVHCETCSGSSTNCTICTIFFNKPFFDPDIQQCVAECPNKTYPTPLKVCLPCLSSCETCTNGTTCQSCDPKYPYQQESICVEKCDSQAFKLSGNKCIPIESSDSASTTFFYNGKLVLTILAIILSLIAFITIACLFVLLKSRVALLISLSSVFAILENITKIFLIFMSLDSWICIAISITYSVNVLFGLSAYNIFTRYNELGYEEWEQYTKLANSKKYPRIYKFWQYLWFLGPQSVRLSSSLLYQTDTNFYQKQSYKDQVIKIIGQCYLFNLVQIIMDIITLCIYSSSFDPFGLAATNLCVYTFSFFSFIREDPTVIKQFFQYIMRRYKQARLRMKRGY